MIWMKTRIHDINVAYEISGDGVPVLWVHGFPLSRDLWRPQVADLADCGRHIVPDLRGFGETDAPAGAYTMEGYAEDLSGLLDALEVRQAVVAGSSMGGYIALSFARLHPDRLLGLILADTRATADSAEAAQTRRDSAAKTLREGTQAVVDGMFPKLLAPATLAQQPGVVQTVRAMLQAASPQGVAGALWGMADRADSTPYLEDITAPTLIIVGAEDAITPPREAQQMAQAIPGSRLVEVAQAGHLSNLEQPDAFNRAVRTFLGKPGLSATS